MLLHFLTCILIRCVSIVFIFIVSSFILHTLFFLILSPYLLLSCFCLIIVLSDILSGVSTGSLLHHFSESSLHLLLLILLEVSHILVLLLPVQIVHKLLAVAFVLPTFLALVASVLTTWGMLIRVIVSWRWRGGGRWVWRGFSRSCTHLVVFLLYWCVWEHLVGLVYLFKFVLFSTGRVRVIHLS